MFHYRSNVLCFIVEWNTGEKGRLRIRVAEVVYWTLDLMRPFRSEQGGNKRDFPGLCLEKKLAWNGKVSRVSSSKTVAKSVVPSISQYLNGYHFGLWINKILMAPFDRALKNCNKPRVAKRPQYKNSVQV